MESELNKAYEYINNKKFYHLSRLTAVANKLIKQNQSYDAKLIKDAIDFFDAYMK